MIIKVDTAFLLHKRDFLNSSLIVSFLTDSGQVKAVIKGAKRNTKGVYKYNIDYISQYSFEFQKKDSTKDLKSIYKIDLVRNFELEQRLVFRLFFLNELIEKFLLEGIESHTLVIKYKDFLTKKTDSSYLEAVFTLFEIIGFMINFDTDSNHRPIVDEEFYSFDGAVFSKTHVRSEGIFEGNVLKNITNYTESAEKVIKIFIRMHLRTTFKTIDFL